MSNKKEGTDLDNVYMAEADQVGFKNNNNSKSPIDKALKEGEQGLEEAMKEYNPNDHYRNYSDIYGTKDEYLATQPEDLKLKELKSQSKSLEKIALTLYCMFVILVLMSVFMVINITDIIGYLKS